MATRKAELKLDDLGGGTEAVTTNPMSPGLRSSQAKLN